MKKNIYLILLLILVRQLSFSQCAVPAMPSASITCGNSHTLTANTNIPTYSFVSSSCPAIPISGTNAFGTPCDDCVTGDIAIGFPFNFYGNVYTDVRIQSNGIIGFGGMTFTGFTGFSIPNSGNPNNYIAGLYADIDITCGGTITYQQIGTAPNRQFVVSYDNVRAFGGFGACTGIGTASFQIVLNENGSFQTIISQLSPDWASFFGGVYNTEITQGTENGNGSYAVATPGRNDQTQPGIGPGATDCYVFNPGVCTFQRWELNGTSIATTTSTSVSPLATTTYTGVWDCAGTVCTGNLTVNVNGPTMTASGITNNTNCNTPNGAFNITMNNFANATYTLNYTLNGAPQSRSVTITSASQVVSFPSLAAGTYANFSVSAGCNSSTFAGPVAITDNFSLPSLSVGSIVNSTNCSAPNGSLIITATGLPAGNSTINYLVNGAPASTVITSTGFTPVAQSTTFNSGTFDATFPVFARPSTFECPSTFATAVYYHSQAFVPSVTGSYTFDGTFVGDGYGLLYSTNFNPSDPCTNFLLANDDGNTGQDPRLTFNLTAGVTYYLVTTTFSNGAAGAYSWTYTGPGGATISTTTGVSTLTVNGLGAGTYTNFTVGTGCNQFVLAGPFTITQPNSPTTTGASICAGATGTLQVTSVCTGGTSATATAMGSGGTAESTTYGGAGNTPINVNFPALPSGSTITGIVVRMWASTPTGASGSPRNQLRVRVTPPAAMGAVQTDIQPSTFATGGSIGGVYGVGAGVTFGVWTGAYLTGNPQGNWVFDFRETVNDATPSPDATISNISITITYTTSGVEWYTASTGGTSISTANPFNPVGIAGSGLANTNTPGTTVYYAACASNTACRTLTSFTINPAGSTAPTSISGAGTICVGNTVTLSQVGGTLASGAYYEWFTGSCGGTSVGTGSSINVSPTTTTTYYVRATGAGACGTTACASATVTLPTQGSTLGLNGESATCTVNQNNYIHFYHSSGRLIASINSMGQNLGNVQVTTYVDAAPIDVYGCGPLSGYVMSALGRRWLVTPQFQPTSPVNIALHFDNGEYSALIPVANGNTNPDDNISALGDLLLSKYSGPLNQDNDASNNCTENGGSGGTTVHNQSSSGNTTTLIGGFGTSGRTAIFSIPGFSELWLHGSDNNVPLPVTLSSFNGNCQNKEIELKWTTASENNSKKFIIEKLRNGNWLSIGEVLSEGNSNSENEYSFIDEAVTSGENYYRLNQIDVDGISKIYDPIKITCNNLFNGVSIYPNPNDGEFILEVNSIETLKDARIEISDLSGKIVYSEKININEGVSYFPINKIDLSSGSYLVKLQNVNSEFKPSFLIKR
jgi:hypothetical protein